MKLAIFLKDEKLSLLEDEIYLVITFKVIDRLITSTENETLRVYNINYLLLWLLNKQIEEIYIQELKEEFRYHIQKIGVKVKSLESIKTHPLLKTFLL